MSYRLTQDQLDRFYNAARQLYDLAVELRAQSSTEVPDLFPTIDGEDWRCYIDRYRDLKKVVENKPAHIKKAFAERHYAGWGKNEGRIWGCRQNENSDTNDIKNAKTIGQGFIWKPVSESRGGVPVILTPPSWPQKKVSLESLDGTKLSRRVEARGPTNPNKETYFFIGLKARELPSPTILVIGDDRYLIEDPTTRIG